MVSRIRENGVSASCESFPRVRLCHNPSVSLRHCLECGNLENLQQMYLPQFIEKLLYF
jgi:hypothetical protein